MPRYHLINAIQRAVLNVPLAQEANLPLPKAPILFTKPRSALSDPYPTPITIPRCAQDGTSDYEAELGVVIGKTGRDIPEEDAVKYILGYTACNDVSCRSLQRITAQWSFSKGLDGSCPVGRYTLQNILFTMKQLESAALSLLTVARPRPRFTVCYTRSAKSRIEGDLQWGCRAARTYGGHDI